MVPWCSGSSSIWPRVSGEGVHALSHTAGVSRSKLITVSSPCVHGRGCESVVRGSRGTAQSWAAALSCTGTRFKCTRMGLTLIWRSCGGLLFKTTRSLLQLLISLCFNISSDCTLVQHLSWGGGADDSDKFFLSILDALWNFKASIMCALITSS